MSQFFPRDVVHWGEHHLHPLRAFAIRSLEPAAATGVVLRVYRALLLSVSASAGWLAFVGGLTGGILLLCGMLTWHLGNFPVRRWPVRVVVFVVIEVIAELSVSALLIGVRRERLGSRVATWVDWWPMASQTAGERFVLLTVFALILATSVQLVRRKLDKRHVHSA